MLRRAGHREVEGGGGSEVVRGIGNVEEDLTDKVGLWEVLNIYKGILNSELGASGVRAVRTRMTSC